MKQLTFAQVVIPKADVQVQSPKSLLFRWAIRPTGTWGDAEVDEREGRFIEQLSHNGDVQHGNHPRG